MNSIIKEDVPVAPSKVDKRCYKIINMLIDIRNTIYDMRKEGVIIDNDDLKCMKEQLIDAADDISLYKRSEEELKRCQEKGKRLYHRKTDL